jgi:hypothetical protein
VLVLISEPLSSHALASPRFLHAQVLLADAGVHSTEQHFFVRVSELFSDGRTVDHLGPDVIITGRFQLPGFANAWTEPIRAAVQNGVAAFPISLGGASVTDEMYLEANGKLAYIFDALTGDHQLRQSTRKIYVNGSSEADTAQSRDTRAVCLHDGMTRIHCAHGSTVPPRGHQSDSRSAHVRTGLCRPQVDGVTRSHKQSGRRRSGQTCGQGADAAATDTTPRVDCAYTEHRMQRRSQAAAVNTKNIRQRYQRADTAQSRDTRAVCLHDGMARIHCAHGSTVPPRAGTSPTADARTSGPDCADHRWTGSPDRTNRVVEDAPVRLVARAPMQQLQTRHRASIAPTLSIACNGDHKLRQSTRKIYVNGTSERIPHIAATLERCVYTMGWHAFTAHTDRQCHHAGTSPTADARTSGPDCADHRWTGSPDRTNRVVEDAPVRLVARAPMQQLQTRHRASTARITA